MRVVLVMRVHGHHTKITLDHKLMPAWNEKATACNTRKMSFLFSLYAHCTRYKDKMELILSSLTKPFLLLLLHCPPHIFDVAHDVYTRYMPFFGHWWNSFCLSLSVSLCTGVGCVNAVIFNGFSTLHCWTGKKHCLGFIARFWNAQEFLLDFSSTQMKGHKLIFHMTAHDSGSFGIWLLSVYA